MSGPLPVIGSLDPWSGGDVLPGVTCVLAPNPSPMTLDGTNTWILTGGGAAVVVDPGPADRGHLDEVTIAVEREGARPELILLTHGHADHSEAATLFSRELRVPVRALDPAHVLGAEGLGAGEVVERGDVVVEVLPTPGHSSDSLSFFLPAVGAVLTGDTLLGRGTTVVAWPDGSLADYLSSLDRLAELGQERDLRLGLPGHGPVIADPKTLLGQYIEHRHERLEQVRTAIAAGAANVAEVVAMVYEPLPAGVYPAAYASATAQWEYLADRGEVPRHSAGATLESFDVDEDHGA